MKLESSLAKQWEVDDSGRTSPIHLRQGLRFSDGTPFTADDVLFSLKALQDPKSLAIQSGQLQIDGHYPTISKVNTHTVRLTFPRKVGMGLRALDSIPILPKHKLDKAYREGNFSSTWGPTADPADVVGLGPFRLKEYQRGIKVVLERNPHYWKKDKMGRSLPYLDTITFLIIQDRNTQALRFQSGELDLVYLLNAENYAGLRRYQRERNFTLRDLGPGLGMDYLWFNLKAGKNSSGEPYLDPEKRAIFEKTKFRRAISHALDRDGITLSIFLGLGKPQYGVISSGNKVWYQQGSAQTEYDPAKARRLLDEIGLIDTDADGFRDYGSPRRPFEISLLTDKGNLARENLALVIRNNLAKVGIPTKIQFFLQNELAARFLSSFDYEAILFKITPTDIVPDLQTELWLSSGALHFWNPAQKEPQSSWEAEMDRLTLSLVRELDPTARKNTFRKIQEIWEREMPAIPTIAPSILVGWKNSLGNLRPAILVPYLLWNVEEITKLTQ
jgi:peptide/nickel transport system substrate-binding protein